VAAYLRSGLLEVMLRAVGQCVHVPLPFRIPTRILVSVYMFSCLFCYCIPFRCSLLDRWIHILVMDGLVDGLVGWGIKKEERKRESKIDK